MGRMYIPTKNHINSTLDKPNRLSISAMPSNLLVAAMVLSTTISRMPSISSMMSTESTFPAKCLCRRPKSSYALYIMVVLLIASMPPRNMLSILFHPNNPPATLPTPIIPAIIRHAQMMGDTPIWIIFLKENSRPRVNIRIITPICPHCSHSSISPMVGVYGI